MRPTEAVVRVYRCHTGAAGRRQGATRGATTGQSGGRAVGHRLWARLHHQRGSRRVQDARIPV